MKTCIVDGCEKTHRARGLCATHYNQQHQPNRHPTAEVECGCCGRVVVKHCDSRRADRFCSYSCRDAWAAEHGIGAFARDPQPKAKRHRVDQRSPLRRAIEDADAAGVIAAIKADCDVRPNGCWEWKRSFKAYYPIAQIAGRQRYVHRLTLEAKLGRPLGKQAAHHICANSFCANPDHLQPVTARENSAEMLARTYMESRIRDLEAALSSFDANHPLLLEIGISPAA